jgi:uncharacterized protein with GYD domain
MPTYVQLMKWTDQGRKDAGTVADRIDQVAERLESELGIKLVGAYVTMGRFDQVVVFEAPNDESVAKAALILAQRGNVVSETLRAFTMAELKALT